MKFKQYQKRIAHPDYPGPLSARGRIAYVHFHVYWEHYDTLPDTSREDILHIDGNRHNNKIGNLALVPLHIKHERTLYTLLKKTKPNQSFFYSAVADNLGYERWKAQKTTKEIELLTGISMAMQSHFENANHRVLPKAFDMHRLAAALQCDIKDLYYPF